MEAYIFSNVISTEWGGIGVGISNNTVNKFGYFNLKFIIYLMLIAHSFSLPNIKFKYRLAALTAVQSVCTVKTTYPLQLNCSNIINNSHI